MKTKFRWVNHDVYGLRLFFYINYSKKETCTNEEESFIFCIDLPEKVLKMMAGKKIPTINKMEIR